MRLTRSAATRPAPVPGRARRLAAARALWLRTLVPPLVIALPPLFWVVQASRCAALTPLGRDQGIFQYVAWALGQGDVDYVDIRDVNGPLTHLVHRALLAMGGADEHRFRVLDLLVTGATFALVGGCLPGLGRKRADEREAPPDARLDNRRDNPRRWAERLAWALAGAVVLGAQYLLYGFWDLAQRESFFDWFMLPSAALQLVAQASPLGAAGARRRLLLFGAAGALSVVPWFGKPTYILFTLAQVGAIAFDDPILPRRDALIAFAAGGAMGAATQLVFLCAEGDPIAFARIQIDDIPAMYRFIWPRAVSDLLSDPWRANQAVYAVVGAVTLLALIALGELPRRAMAVAALPICALAGVVAQAKGFPYHFHPVSAGIHLQWLVAAAWLAERAGAAQRRGGLVRALPVIAGAALALRVATALEDSPHLRSARLLWTAATAEQRRTQEYFAYFPEPDFFPYEMREAADYLRASTAPLDRVQTYGMDPYVLFLARRLSATPYIYAYDFNADAALAGGSAAAPRRRGARRDSCHA